MPIWGVALVVVGALVLGGLAVGGYIVYQLAKASEDIG